MISIEPFHLTLNIKRWNSFVQTIETKGFFQPLLGPYGHYKYFSYQFCEERAARDHARN